MSKDIELILEEFIVEKYKDKDNKDKLMIFIEYLNILKDGNIEEIDNFIDTNINNIMEAFM